MHHLVCENGTEEGMSRAEYTPDTKKFLGHFKSYEKIARREKEAELVLKHGSVLNVLSGEILEADVVIQDGIIMAVGQDYHGRKEIDVSGKYILPGLIDAHLHLESTMVRPGELVRTAASVGTTSFIVDPHEAANVAGLRGIDFILKETEDVPANVFVMMPSCVPATPLDDNGVTLSAADMAPYLSNPRILGLGEVMDSVSVIHAVPAMMEKLRLFSEKTLDGHAPFLKNEDLSAYALSGICTDHEATSYEYAMEEVRRGIHVHIREGSAAHNLEAIVSGIVSHHSDTSSFSFCTDDKHIEDILKEGHISNNVRLAISFGLTPMQAVRMATIQTARLYGLKHLGAVAEGYQADLLIVGSLEKMDVLSVFHKGRLLSEQSREAFPPIRKSLLHTVHLKEVDVGDFILPIRKKQCSVMVMEPRQILTREEIVSFGKTKNFLPEEHPGYLKIASLERHHNTGKIGLAVLSGYGLRHGAVASSVSHDSHNITVIGDNDEDMALAVRELRRVQGGYTVVSHGKVFDTLPLPIMGLMSDQDFHAVQKHLGPMIQKAHEMGVPEDIEPFIALSFLSLPVLPVLRITPRGLCRVTEKGARIL